MMDPRRKPGPRNTGVRGAYGSLTPSGPVTVTTPGAVVDGLDITGGLTVRADDVTVQNCRIRPVQSSRTFYTVTWAKVATRPPQGLLLVDVEIDGDGIDGTPDQPIPAGWSQSTAIQPGIGYTLLRCDIHGHMDGLKSQDNATPILVEDTWIHSLVVTYGATGMSHNDCLQVAGTGATGLTVRHCTLDGYRPGDPVANSRYASSSLMQWGSYPNKAGVLADVLLEENWIDGGLYASRLSFTSAAQLRNVVIRGNRFGLRHRYGVFASRVPALDGGDAVVDGNVWDVAGTTDFGLSVTAGQAIP